MSVVEVSPRGWPDNVRIFYTTRTGGCSQGVYRGFNLGLHVGDEDLAVQENRAELLQQLPLGTTISWLEQIHGRSVVPAIGAPQIPPRADACWTSDLHIACAVMVADCLPVLLSDRSGSVVAAVHAGWRGLAAGVLESAVSALNVAPRELYAWLGPAIGRDAFEVGAEVRSAFLQQDNAEEYRDCFRSSPNRSGHYLADLNALAVVRLRKLGLEQVQGLDACTFSDPGRFFSYRRDGVTGRMACLIVRDN